VTAVYLTIDTEYAAHLPGANGSPGTRADNFAHSIACETAAGAVGIFHQMDVLDAHGLRGVFFVDPMPALLWGIEAIADVVRPIAARGHDVQLHCHTEWLEYAAGSALEGMPTGRNLRDFTREEQATILEFARDTLVAAGAPSPVAFRAGNYGANDDTLAVLAELGIAYDTSHCPALSGRGDCAISLGPDDLRPIAHRGVIEVPAACVESFGGTLRHGQLTALSLRELVAAVRHARDEGIASVTLVSHSFELLSRDRRRINRLVAHRFARLCAAIAEMPGVTTATYAAQPPAAEADGDRPAPLPHDALRGGLRIIEQAVSNAFYSRPLRAGTQHAVAIGAVLLT
jgi:peptidoglycan/xylan/chitin deacetylase (PgdA/CDA1 family)